MKVGDKVRILVWNSENDPDIHPSPIGTIGTIIEDKSDDLFYCNPYRVEANGQTWWYKAEDIECI